MADRAGRKSGHGRPAGGRGGLFAHFEAAEGVAAESPALEWRRTMRSRIFVVAAGMALWTIGIEARLFVLQVWQFDAMGPQSSGSSFARLRPRPSEARFWTGMARSWR